MAEQQTQQAGDATASHPEHAQEGTGLLPAAHWTQLAEVGG